MDRSILLGSLVLALTAPLATAQKLWVVAPAPGPGVNFTQPSLAIAAAADGDTILVRAGTYAGFQIGAKGVALQADGSVKITGNVFVFAVAAGQTVVLRGFEIPYGTLRVTNCAGTVWIEDCTLNGGSVYYSTPAYVALEISSSSSVVLVNVSAAGGTQNFVGWCCGSSAAYPAMIAAGSNVHALGSTFAGSSAATFEYVGSTAKLASDGALGIKTSGGFLLLSGSTVTGGHGGIETHPAVPYTCTCTLPAAGVEVGGPVWRLDSTVQGGSSGGPFFSCTGCTTAPPFSGDLSQLHELAGTRVELDVAAPLHESTSPTLTVSAPAGSFAVLGIGFEPLSIFDPSFGGSFLVAPPHLLVLLGSVPPSGAISIQLPLTDLGAGIDFLRAYAQAAAIEPSALAIAGEATAVLVLDGAF